jgi:hypothetical protein
MRREILLDAVLLAPAERRIGQHDIHAVALQVADAAVPTCCRGARSSGPRRRAAACW